MTRVNGATGTCSSIGATALLANTGREPSMPELACPPVVWDMLKRGASSMLSFSGGADSQAMLEVCTPFLRAWPGHIKVAHADLGRAEWPQTPGHVRFVCDRLGLPLSVVRRPQGDLLAAIQKRHEDLRARGESAPPFPDAANRYCTSDQKRAQLDKVARNPWPTSTMRYCTADHKRDQLAGVQRSAGGLVLVAIGMRA
jgi:zinc transporter ZupT